MRRLNTKRRAAKKGASHAARRTQPRKTGKQAQRRKGLITPEQARRLAARHMMPAMFDGVPVRDGAGARLRLYNVPRKDVWVVFPRINPKLLGFFPSTVVVVCKRTGRVLYAGSVNDEG